ncbi:MAG: uroporphyrinogen-III C-methyltransferase [Alphaproteobacteria bacterium]
MKGKVYITGAGPGDPELLTIKALNAFKAVHVVVYDRLVSDEIMALIPEHVEKIFAGKSCKQKAMTQDEINSLLVKLAQEGKHVLRLKGGDPMLFGRGGEEIIVLRQEGLAFEVIPGITSAQGCGAIANIPLTHRGLATGVRFFTGHRMTKEDAEQELELDWQSLADPETTLVVYMGLANLALICEKLIAHGLPADFPAAAIENGTNPKEKLILSTLEQLAADVANAGLEPPTLVIIGKVVELSEKIRI